MKSFVNRIVQWSMLVISIILVGASIRYSATWHIYIGMDPIWAWSLATGFILFSVFCFDIGYGMIQDRKKKRKSKKQRLSISHGWFFLLLWFFITIYSMSSTVAGQYNQLLIKEASRSTEKEDTGLENVLQDIEDKQNEIESLSNPVPIPEEFRKILVQDIDKQISELEKERDNINTILEGLESLEQNYEWKNTTQGNRDRLDNIRDEISDLSDQKKEFLLSGIFIDYDRINALKDDIDNLKITRDELIEQGATVKSEEDINRGNIFEYFSEIFGPSPSMMQFLLSVFPAVFIDLISPISSALFFYGIPGIHTSEVIVKKEEEIDIDSIRKESEIKGYSKGRESAFKSVEQELQRRLELT